MINTSIFKITKKEIAALKREVKKATGRAMNSIDIESFSDSFIRFSFYETNYARVTNQKSFAQIAR